MKQMSKKPLDTLGVLFICISIGLVISGVLFRSVLNDSAIKHKIESIHGFQGIWISLPDDVLWLPMGQKNTVDQKISKSELGLPKNADVVDMDFFYASDFKQRPNSEMTDTLSGGESELDNNHNDENTVMLWLRLLSGEISKCQLDINAQQIKVVKQCQTVVPENGKAYNNIVQLPQIAQLMTINNLSANIDRFDGVTGEKQQTNITYTLPNQGADEANLVEAVEELGEIIGPIDGLQKNKLYRPNQGMVASNIAVTLDGNTNDYYVQTDTGRKRLIAWKLNEKGLPSFNQPASQWLDTLDQPYFFAYLTHPDTQIDTKQKVVSKWLVLESGVLLENGYLVEYTRIGNKQSTHSPVDIPLSDPTQLTQIGNKVFVLEQNTGKIVQVDYSTSFSEPVISAWQDPIITHKIQAVYKERQYLQWLTTASFLFLLAPFLCILILHRMGYQLNQKL